MRVQRNGFISGARSIVTQHNRGISNKIDNCNTQPNCNTIAKDQSEAAAMEGAKDFMDQARSIIDELQEVPEFQSKVMLSDKPVILECYAP